MSYELEIIWKGPTVDRKLGGHQSWSGRCRIEKAAP
jgi:hypothetical protein